MCCWHGCWWALAPSGPGSCSGSALSCMCSGASASSRSARTLPSSRRSRSRARCPTRSASCCSAASVWERILAAAVALLHEGGIQGWSQVQVARRAKVRQSHVTYYFPKRHDLIDALAQHVTGGMALALRGVLESAEGRDLRPVLRRLARDIAAREHMRMFTGLIVEADHDPKLRAILVRWTLSLQETLATALGGQGAIERSRLTACAITAAHEVWKKTQRRRAKQYRARRDAAQCQG